MIVMQRRFSDVRIKDTETSPTLEMSGGVGGGNLPMILIIDEDESDKNDEVCRILHGTISTDERDRI